VAALKQRGEGKAKQEGKGKARRDTVHVEFKYNLKTTACPSQYPSFDLGSCCHQHLFVFTQFELSQSLKDVGNKWISMPMRRQGGARCASGLGNEPQPFHPDIPRLTQGLAIVPQSGLDFFFLVFF
jgi:hypothetical protein